MSRRGQQPRGGDEVHVDALSRLQPYMNAYADRHPEPSEPEAEGATLEQPAAAEPEPDDGEDGLEGSVPFTPEPAQVAGLAQVEGPNMTQSAGEAHGLRAELDKAPQDVAAMFDRVAARYDLVNDLLALGQTRVWRSMVARAVHAGPGERVLDLAAGTGTSSAPFAAAGAEVVPCDFSLGMLEVGKRRQPHLPFVAGDAMHLPFRDGAFDAVTISFGLRNVQDPDLALREMLRVTKPGGRLVVCEFSSPVNRWFRTVYTEYLMRALPAVARRTASNPAAYEYLAESIRAWPDQAGLAARLQAAGWERVQWRNATGGIVAIHRGYKPTA